MIRPESGIPNGERRGRAAEYVRMSTEAQEYSIPFQQTAIREYAQQHGLNVVRTYADPGRSGLNLKNRPGLIQLLDDVQSGTTDYEIVLVYDVSRWGRFQDTDESGFYEYLCRRAGIRVQYCVELFSNDGGPLAAILKNIKRVMAAEYSREQSERVHRACSKAAALGRFSGGAVTFGLRRMLVSSDNVPMGILKKGERSAIRGNHTVLTPGPIEEQRIVRRIFRLYAHHGLTCREIADRLNRDGKVNRLGRPWYYLNIWEIIQNERYIGTQIYNERSRKLKAGPRHKNPRELHVRKENAFPAIVPKSLFDAAQRVRKKRGHREYTDAEMLDHLRALWRANGRLSFHLIDQAAPPRVHTYQKRFGALLLAYARIGFVQDLRCLESVRTHGKSMSITRGVIEELASLLREHGAIVARSADHHPVWLIDNQVSVVAKVVRRYRTPIRQKCQWRFVITRKAQPDYTILVLMDDSNERPAEFLLLPKRCVRPCYKRMNARAMAKLARYRAGSIAEVADRLFDAVQRRKKSVELTAMRSHVRGANRRSLRPTSRKRRTSSQRSEAPR